MARRALACVLAGWLCGCVTGEVRSEPVLGPPPKPVARTPASAPVETPAAPEHVTADRRPAEATKPATIEPPQETVWRTIDFGQTSAEMPEPIDDKAHVPDNFQPGAKAATATLGDVMFFAGEGPYWGPSDEAEDVLMLAANPSSPPSMQSSKDIDLKGELHECVRWLHRNGTVTLGKFRFRTQAGKPGWVAWRIAVHTRPGPGPLAPTYPKGSDRFFVSFLDERAEILRKPPGKPTRKKAHEIAPR